MTGHRFLFQRFWFISQLVPLKAIKAIGSRWPQLERSISTCETCVGILQSANSVSGFEVSSGSSNWVKGILPLEFEPVVRFYEPGELDRDENKVPVIDLMLR